MAIKADLWSESKEVTEKFRHFLFYTRRMAAKAKANANVKLRNYHSRFKDLGFLRGNLGVGDDYDRVTY